MSSRIDELCTEFAGVGPGTPVRFDRGTDFDTSPATFRNTLHRRMRRKGWIIATKVSGTSVYAEIAGTEPAPA